MFVRSLAGWLPWSATVGPLCDCPTLSPQMRSSWSPAPALSLAGSLRRGPCPAWHEQLNSKARPPLLAPHVARSQEQGLGKWRQLLHQGPAASLHDAAPWLRAEVFV